MKRQYKKMIYVGIVMLVWVVCLMAQPPETEWSKTYGGVDYDKGSSVKLTDDNGYIISGYTSTGWWHDYYLVKTDQFGDSLWTRRYCAEGHELTHEFGYDVQQTSDRGYIICGIHSLPRNDIYLVKTDSLGEILWTKVYGGPDTDDIATNIQETSDGGYIVIGSRLLVGSGRPYDYNVWLLKLDAEGDTTWTKTFGSTANGEFGKTIQQTTDGGYFITGHIVNGSANYYAVYLIKTDFAGDILWTTMYENYYVEAMDGQLTSDKGYIVTGRWSNGPTHANDFFLAKFDSLGNHSWTRLYGTDIFEIDECGTSVQQTQDNGYIIVGYLIDPWIGDFGDIYVVRTDSLGDTLWTKRYESYGVESATEVQITSDGGYILVGSTNSIGAGGFDVYLIKLGPEPGVEENMNTQNVVALGLKILPNPVVRKSRIEYELPIDTRVTLKIYDISGRVVDKLIDHTIQTKGMHSVLWHSKDKDGKDIPAGVYFCQLKTEKHEVVKKILLLQ